MRILTAFALLFIALCGWSQSSSPGATKSVHELLLEDQSELPTHQVNGKPPVSYGEFLKHAALRRAKVHAMLEAGQLKTGDDFHDASTIYQHSDSAEDILLAHVLAVEAVIKGDDRSKWMAAATLDRYLQMIKQPQIFGTQYPALEKKEQAAPGTNLFAGRTQAPYNDELLPNALRLDFCVPTIEQQKKNIETFNAGRYPGSAMVAPGCSR